MTILKTYAPTWVLFLRSLVSGGHSFGRWWWAGRPEAHQLCEECAGMRTPKSRRSRWFRDRVN